MDSFLSGLGSNMGLLAMGGGFAICIVAIATALMVAGRARERTRRELAAYVAEGSMTADEAERILSAGRPTCCSGRLSRRPAPASPPAHV